MLGGNDFFTTSHPASRRPEPQAPEKKARSRRNRSRQSRTIVVAEHDPLQDDDGVLYADALRAAGVAVKVLEYPAKPQGFLNVSRFARDAKPTIAAVMLARRGHSP
jgi:acetyl esterase/lipase